MPLTTAIKSSYNMNCDSFNVTVTRKRVKRMILKVDGTSAEVSLTLPVDISPRDARIFVETRRSWIEKHRSRILSLPRIEPLRFVTGESVSIWGDRFSLEVNEVKRGSGCSIEKSGVLSMRVSFDADIASRQKTLDDYYRNCLKSRIPGLVEKWEIRLGVKCTAWSVRKMKTKWGSCNITRGRINLSLSLAQKPVECLEYVVVHELVHLLERHHNKRFYALLDEYCPDWKAWEGGLEARD